MRYEAYQNLMESLDYIKSLIVVEVTNKESLWSKIKAFIKKFKNLIIAIGVIIALIFIIKLALRDRKSVV